MRPAGGGGGAPTERQLDRHTETARQTDVCVSAHTYAQREGKRERERKGRNEGERE